MISDWFSDKLQDSFQLSVKKEEYVKSLINKIHSEAPDPKTLVSEDLIFAEISKRLDKEVIKWSDLCQDDVKTLIRNLESDAPASEHQIKAAYMNMKHDRSLIDELLNRKVKNDKLSIFEAQYLLKISSKFIYPASEHLILTNNRYDHGWYESDSYPDRRMEYLRFRDTLMITFKHLSEDSVRCRLVQMTDYTFVLYKIFDGFRAFIVNKQIFHASEESLAVLQISGCDPYYRAMSHANGFISRISPKYKLEDRAATYIATIGLNKPDPMCMLMIEMHDRYIGS